MGLDKLNAMPCERTLNNYQLDNFKEAIENDYHYKLYVDGLPSAVIIRDPETGSIHKEYHEGIPVGKLVTDPNTGKDRHILYNHWILSIKV